MKKAISAAVVALTLLTACNTQATASEPALSSETATQTEATTEKAPEPASSAETTVHSETTESVASSPDDYVFDSGVVWESDDGFTPEPEKPYLIASEDDVDSGMYAVLTDDGMLKTFILRNRILSSFEAVQPWSKYSIGKYGVFDIDNDGDREYYRIRQILRGSGCNMQSLTIFDLDSEHYVSHSLISMNDPDAFMCDIDDYVALIEKNVGFDIDEDNKTVTFTSLNSDSTMTVDTSESFPDGIDVSFNTTIVQFYTDGDKLMMKSLPSSDGSPLDIPYECMPWIISEIKFDGTDFFLADTRFEEITS